MKGQKTFRDRPKIYCVHVFLAVNGPTFAMSCVSVYKSVWNVGELCLNASTDPFGVWYEVVTEDGCFYPLDAS